ncbi:hypothetical protein CEY16_12445, partial [Halalkalibacillus sediminis]
MYYHYDGMSSVSELTDRHGDIIERYRYDAFGGLMTGITAPYNTNSYTGHQYDQDTGLVDMQARVYDAKIGRFLQEDTYSGTLDNPLSQNRYAYVMNDPVNFWDPTGRVPEELIGQDSFNHSVRVGTYDEIWKYQLQGIDQIDEWTENYSEVDNGQAITVTWDIVTKELLRYEAKHILNHHDPDGNGYLEPITYDRTKNESFIRFIRDNYELVTTAEELMEQNYEKVIKHGEVPEGSVKVSSASMSFHNPIDKFKQIFNTGTVDIKNLIRMVALNSSSSNIGYGNIDYWKGKAANMVDLNAEPIKRNKQINAAYAEMYLSDPDVYMWAGLATFASKDVGKGMSDVNDLNSLEKLAALQLGLKEEELNRLFELLAAGNRGVYEDIYWQHLAYDELGLREIKDIYIKGEINSQIYDAWKLIDTGKQTNNQDLIWKGTMKLAEYEQTFTLQEPVFSAETDLYQELSILDKMNFPYTTFFKSPTGKGERYRDVSDGNIAELENRMNWIENEVNSYKTWYESSPNEVIYRIRIINDPSIILDNLEDVCRAC